MAKDDEREHWVIEEEFLTGWEAHFEDAEGILVTYPGIEDAEKNLKGLLDDRDKFDYGPPRNFRVKLLSKKTRLAEAIELNNEQRDFKNKNYFCLPPFKAGAFFANLQLMSRAEITDLFGKVVPVSNLIDDDALFEEYKVLIRWRHHYNLHAGSFEKQAKKLEELLGEAVYNSTDGVKYAQWGFNICTADRRCFPFLFIVSKRGTVFETTPETPREHVKIFFELIKGTIIPEKSKSRSRCKLVDEYVEYTPFSEYHRSKFVVNTPVVIEDTSREEAGGWFLKESTRLTGGSGSEINVGLAIDYKRGKQAEITLVIDKGEMINSEKLKMIVSDLIAGLNQRVGVNFLIDVDSVIEAFIRCGAAELEQVKGFLIRF